MSEVELLLRQEKVNCEVLQNFSQQMTDDDKGNREPSGDKIRSKNGKHREACEFHKHDVCKICLNLNSVERKRKHRRSKKRKWRPYCKLSWDERREVDERNARRANRIRAEMCTNGHTLAPYNTTQFLMDDHILPEPDYQGHPNGHRHRENSSDPSEEFYSSPEDEEHFLQKQFAETYENIHTEHLNSLTQSEIALELMSLEDRMEMLLKRLEAAKEVTDTTQTVGSEVQTSDFLHEQVLKLTVFREEIQKLTRENEVLRWENDCLRTKLSADDEEEDDDIL